MIQSILKAKHRIGSIQSQRILQFIGKQCYYHYYYWRFLDKLENNPEICCTAGLHVSFEQAQEITGRGNLELRSKNKV